MPPSAHRANATLGIALMLLGMFMFAVNDVLGKWLVATYSVGQLLLIRSLAAIAVLAPFVWRAGAAALVRVERPWLQLFRVACSTAEVATFYWAVSYLPLADVMTYWLAAPIYVAALSPLVLGERVGWRRWSAICVGFAGVVIALDPSAATLTLPALISILGSLLFAVLVMTGRMLRGTPDITLAFWQVIAAAIGGAVIAPFGWVAPTALDFALLGVLGVVAVTAHVCVNRSLKLADAATVAPYQYTLLAWAIIFGWAVFGDTPRAQMLIGGAIIIAAGLYIVFREYQLARLARRGPAP